MYGEVIPSRRRRTAIAAEIAGAEQRAYERLETARLPEEGQSPLHKPSGVFGLTNAEVEEFNSALADMEEHVLGMVEAFPIGQCRRTLTDVLRRVAASIPQAGNPKLLADRIPAPLRPKA